MIAALEAGHAGTAEQGLEGGADVRHRHAELGGALAVDVDLELRLVELEVGIHVEQVAELLRLAHHGAHRLLQVVVGVGLQDELHGTAEAAAQARQVDRDRQHAGNRDHPAEQCLHDLLLAAMPLSVGLEPHEHETIRHASRAAEPQPDRGEEALHLRHLRVDRLGLLHVAIGVVEGRALGRQHDVEDQAAVLGGDELRGQQAKQHGDRRQDAERAQHHAAPMGERPAQQALVAGEEGQP